MFFLPRYFSFSFDAILMQGDRCDLDVICKYFSLIYKNQTSHKIRCNIDLEYLEGYSLLKRQFSTYACLESYKILLKL